MPRRTTPAEDGINTVTEEHTADTQDQQNQQEQPQEAQSEPLEQTATPEDAPDSAASMKINVRITSTRNVYDDNTRATATVTLNDVFVIKGVRVVKGENGLFCSMPARKLRNGDYSEVCHPITKDFALKLNASVLNEYQVHLHQQMEESQQTPHIYEPDMEQSQSLREPEYAAAVPEMEMI